MADKGLKRSVADIFPDAIHLPCCFHLLQNAKKKGAVDVALFWWVQASPSVAEFELRMEKLAQKSHGNAVEYLSKIEEYWVLHQQVDLGVQTFGFRTSNLSEILNARLLLKRELPPFLIMMATCRMAAKDLVEACIFASKLKETMGKEPLTPYAIAVGKKIRAEAENAGLQGTIEVVADRDGCVVEPASFGRVKQTHGLNSRRVLAPTDTDDGSCECKKNFTMGYYCIHAYVAERFNLIVFQKSDTG